jgi:hypothetical protein
MANQPVSNLQYPISLQGRVSIIVSKKRTGVLPKSRIQKSEIANRVGGPTHNTDQSSRTTHHAIRTRHHDPCLTKGSRQLLPDSFLRLLRQKPIVEIGKD